MIVMCLDPSLRNTGLAVLETKDNGLPNKIVHKETLKTSFSKGDAEYVQIGNAIANLQVLFKKYDPALVVSEIPYGAQSFKGAVSVGYSMAISAMLKAYPVRPQSIAEMIKGYTGNDKKAKSIQFVAERLYTPAAFWNKDEMNHIADAICAYYVYLSREKLLNFEK